MVYPDKSHVASARQGAVLAGQLIIIIETGLRNEMMFSF